VGGGVDLRRGRDVPKLKYRKYQSSGRTILFLPTHARTHVDHRRNTVYMCMCVYIYIFVHYKRIARAQAVIAQYLINPREADNF